jgi:hypothetical protein
VSRHDGPSGFHHPEVREQAPSLATCASCQSKFFTLNSYYSDPFGAEQYLRSKFEVHHCLAEQKKDKKGRVAEVRVRFQLHMVVMVSNEQLPLLANNAFQLLTECVSLND